MKKLILIFFMFLFVRFSYSAGTTYYVDCNAVNDSGNGQTWGTAKKYIKSGIGLLSGGDILIIADGTYSNASDMCNNGSNWEWINGIPDGTASQYTQIKASNTWGVTIDGGGTKCPWALDSISYCRIEGLIFANSGGSGMQQCMVWLNSDHIKVIRCAGYESAGDTEIFSIRYSEYCLYEECFAWGRGRYLFQFYENPAGKSNAYNIARRCVARFDYEALARPAGSFVSYWADNSYFFNNIAIDGLTCTYVPRTLYCPNGTDNITYDSNIILKQSGWAGQYEDNPVNPRIINNVFYDCNTNGLRLGGTPSGSLVSSNTFGNIGGSFIFRQDAGSNNVHDNIMYNSITGLYSAGSQITDNYNVLYGNTNNFYGDSAGANDYCSQNSNAFNPTTNGLLYLSRIETGSSLISSGTAGGRIGANILYQIGNPETLYGDSGWNTLTATQLWPFPNEDTIRTKMRTYSSHGVDGTRGFCATGQTLTKYIWEYLGNTIPADIYGSTFTVNAPNNLILTSISTSNIHLKWTDNSNNEEYFRIERKQTGAYDEIATLSANTTFYLNTGLIAGTTYTYKVRASSGTVYSTYTSEVSTVTQGAAQSNPSPPNQPTGAYIISVTSYSVEFGWSDNSANETGFNIKREVGADYFYFLSSVTANTTSYIDTNLYSNTSYYYKIRAYNDAGNSDYSGECSTLTLNAPVVTTPNMPSILGFVNITTFSVQVNWVDNSSNELGFKIDRSTDSSVFTQIDSVTANTENYTNTNLTSGLTYYYKIRAFNESGNSAYTDTLSVTISVGGTLNVGEISITGQKANGIFSSTNTISIQFQGSNINDYTFRLKDLTHSIQNSEVKSNIQNGTFTLNLAGKKSGVYIITVTGAGIDNSRKIIIIE